MPQSLLVILLLACIYCNAQPFKQSSIWYLGGRIGFDFKYDPARVLNDGQVFKSDSRTSAITDEVGNLLFYTNGDTVWNNLHEIMQNGVALYEDEYEWPITSVIVPHPGDGDLYFVFTMSWKWWTLVYKPFVYAVVNISANEGRGSVIKKGIKVIDATTFLLTVTGHADEQSFWVITHGYENDKFYAFKISETGIASPVISSIGPIYDSFASKIKISPDGTKLVVVNFTTTEIYDFNAMTGIVSNPRYIVDNGAIGIEFSPNSELIYTPTFQGNLIQYDVSTGDLADILTSEIIVGEWPWTGQLVDIQLAYNGKIYGNVKSSKLNQFMSIEYPNLKGLGCTLKKNALPLSTDLVYIFLPLSVQSYYRESPSIVASPVCKNIPAQLHITSMGYADSLIWDFGDGEVKSYPASSGKIISHIYEIPGEYPLKVKKYIGTLYREIESTVLVIDKPEVNLGADTILCAGENIILDAGAQGTNYQWSIGASTRTITVQEAGTYEVVVNNGVCTSTDAIEISVNEYPEVLLGDDKIICDQDSTELAVEPNVNYSYQWSTRAKTDNITVGASGDYAVTVSHGRCSSSDQIHIQFARVKNFQLSDTFINTAYGENIYLEAQGINIDSWRWTFGDGSEETTSVPSITYSYEKAGHYQGRLLASNFYGCTDEAFFEVNVPHHLFIPNVFTPNNDGVNDAFEIQYNGREDINVVIYNRWGEVLFSSNTPEKTWNGSGVSGGTYYYKIIAGKMFYKGWVAVLR